MRPRLPNSPAKLVLVDLFGCLMMAGAFLPISQVRHLLHYVGPLTCFCIFLGLLGAGLYLALQAELEIRNGIAAERWTEIQLAPVRKVFLSPLALPASLVLSLALIAVSLILLFIRPHHTAVIWPYILISQALSRLTMALKTPRPRSSAPTPDWRSSPPIHSDHWGER